MPNHLSAPRLHGIQATPDAYVGRDQIIARNHANVQLLFATLSKVKRVTHALLHAHLRLTGEWFVLLHQSVQVSKANHHFHHCFVPTKVKTSSPLHVLQSVMTECQCMYTVIQDPSLVVRACHEGLGLLHHTNIESLVVDSLEAAPNCSISIPLCLKDTLVQLDVLHAHPLSIDHDIARNSLCCVVYHLLLINQAVHLWSQTNELRDTMPVVLILEDGTRQLLVEVEERFQ